MRCLDRNKCKIWYALYEGSPVEIYASVSSATGMLYVRDFGNDIVYDKVILIDDIDTPIDEHTVFCIDKEPTYNEDNNLVYDYVVKRVAKSLNNVRIAVSRVDVS